MDPVTPATQTLRSVDLALLGGITLRVSATEDSLVLALGYGGAGSDTPFHRPAWGAPPLTLPSGALPRLREALGALEAEPLLFQQEDGPREQRQDND